MEEVGTAEEKARAAQSTANKKKCSCSLEGTRYCEICLENPNKRALKIKSARSSELASDIVVDGVRYHVQTEKLGARKPVIITHVCKDGEIISSRKSDYSNLLGDYGLDKKLGELMEKQHMSAVNMLKTEKPKVGRNPSIYLEEVKRLLRANNQRGAIRVLDTALTEHPFNPFLLSYYGWLKASVDRDFARGVEICRDAMGIFREEAPFGHEVFYPVFYLNLGKAYLAGRDKQNAVEAFRKGLESDPENADLLWELKSLGRRKKPVIIFLKRSNPVNKYIGMFVR